MLRDIPPFECENWGIIALGGFPNNTQVGNIEIDGRLSPVAAAPTKAGGPKGETPALEQFLDNWYPIQVKDKIGRSNIDGFFRRSGKTTIAFTVREFSTKRSPGSCPEPA